MLAAHYTPEITNPYSPARPGMVWVYRGADGGRRLREVVRVTAHVEVVDGVRCATIRDKVYLDGRLAEDTTDWYSQDARGTVWYFGEDTHPAEGAWRAGVHGARAGVFMPAHPRVGSAFEQEHFPGHAEDHFRIVGHRGRVLRTREWTPLEPGVREYKRYRRGVGLVGERGPGEHADLVSWKP
jgi:hypothetical protein